MKLTRVLGSLGLGLMALVGVAWLLRPVEPVRARTSAVGNHVILSEVLYDPAGTDDGWEWVEVFNPTSNTIDLNNYSLGNGPQAHSGDYLYSVAQLSGQLLPGQCWVIGGPTSGITNSNPSYHQVFNFKPDLRNATGITASGVALFNLQVNAITSQSIPLDAVIYGVSNTMQLIDETGVANPPDVGGATSSKTLERTDITGTWHVQTTPTPNKCSVLTMTVELPPLTPPGSVLISAVHYAAYAGGDEGFRLTNVSTQPVTLTNWIATDGEATLNLTGTLAPDQSIWLARNAVTFTQQFGFQPDYEYEDNSGPVPNLSGGVPLLNTSDELAIREGASHWIDAVVWGPTGQITDTGWLTGWVGPSLQRYTVTNTFGAEGLILYRKLDEAAGKIITDTDTAQDWANDRTDPIAGRKLLHPGWDLEKFWQTAKVTGTATLTVAISPDNAYRVISDVLGSAQSSIRIEMNTFDNLGLLNAVTQTLARNVSVTILLEGSPAGGIDDQERWVCQQIEHTGGQCWFMISKTTSGNHIHARYKYLHVKMIVVDDRVVAIGSENLSPRTLTYDDPADGTIGHRGAYLVTDARGVVSRALEIWSADFDPANHHDLYRWNENDPTYGAPPSTFFPNYDVEVSGYRIRYPQPLMVTGPLTFELLTAPESALRASDALLGWINRSGAGDTIDVEQLDEPPHWGNSASNPVDDPNLRLQALIDAAQRGAKVRLLLDRYFDDPTSPTSNHATVQYLEQLRAISSTLHGNVEVRLGNPALYGVHSKLFLFDLDGRKIVHAGSLNGTETSNKANREVALQVESSAAYDYLRTMFEYDWAFQPRALLPLITNNYLAPPNHVLISKVFYLGSTSMVTGSEWVQIYNPTRMTVTLSGYKIGDQAAPGPTGFTVDGMWRFPLAASLGPSQTINIALTASGFFTKYGFLPNYVFFTDTLHPVPGLTPYLAWTNNISFALANSGDEVLLLDGNDQLVDGVAWGTGSLPGNVSCLAIDPSQYPLGNPSITREPLWKDTNDCPNDFVIDETATP